MNGRPVRERLRGAWRLESFAFADDAGAEWYPLGCEPRGFLFITEDDHVAFNFMAADRRPFAADDLFGGRPEELASAAATVVSFAGPFRIEGETLVIDVQYSLFPNWIGSTQVRGFAFEGETLVLSTLRPVPFGGTPRRARARLRRPR
jgi:hypothetical protein